MDVELSCGSLTTPDITGIPNVTTSECWLDEISQSFSDEILSQDDCQIVLARTWEVMSGHAGSEARRRARIAGRVIGQVVAARRGRHATGNVVHGCVHGVVGDVQEPRLGQGCDHGERVVGRVDRGVVRDRRRKLGHIAGRHAARTGRHVGVIFMIQRKGLRYKINPSSNFVLVFI